MEFIDKKINEELEKELSEQKPEFGVYKISTGETVFNGEKVQCSYWITDNDPNNSPDYKVYRLAAGPGEITGPKAEKFKTQIRSLLEKGISKWGLLAVITALDKMGDYEYYMLYGNNYLDPFFSSLNEYSYFNNRKPPIKVISRTEAIDRLIGSLGGIPLTEGDVRRIGKIISTAEEDLLFLLKDPDLKYSFNSEYTVNP